MINGIDVSYFVGDVNTDELLRQGIEFASIRCCEGLEPDSKHGFFTKKLRGAGILTNSYQFGHPSMDMKALADCFLEHAFYDQLLPVIDMESLARGADGQLHVPANAGLWLISWLDYVASRIGFMPLSYASTSYFNAMIAEAPELRSSDRPKWIAEYHAPMTTLHLPKCAFEYVAWQYAGDIPMVGVTGLVDRDVCMGALTTLLVPAPDTDGATPAALAQKPA